MADCGRATQKYLDITMKESSLKKRYFYKLSINLAGYMIGLITVGIIPRGLGPKAYGDLNFLNSFFTQVVGFLDMGSSTALYTKLSQRQRESGLLSFYSRFIGVVIVVVIIFVGLSSPSSIHHRLWPGQKLFYICLAALLAILGWVTGILGQATDAFGLTVPAEMRKLYQKVIWVGIIVLLYCTRNINLKNYFLCQYFVLFFLGSNLIYLIVHNGYFSREGWKLPARQAKGYIKEFVSYCHPLFICSVIGLAAGILDRWILQFYGGSVQQGFYALAYRIGAMCFILTGSMTPLLTREFSISFGKKDLSEMASLFRRYIPLFYSITAYFCCFAVFQAEKLVYIFGGRDYKAAILPVTMMAFNPIHQTYGQLSAAVFLATGQTKLFSKISIIFTLLGLPATYFLIAPHDKMGLEAGAVGLAMKMVLLQVAIVNTQLYFNAKFLRLSFRRYLSHQVLSVVCLLCLAALATYGADKVFGLHKIASFIIAGVGYTLMVIGIIYYFPASFGLKGQDIKSLISKIKGYRSFYK